MKISRFFSLACFAFVSQATLAQTTAPSANLGGVLNQCLAHSGASAIDCGGEVVRASDAERLKFRYEPLIPTGDPTQGNSVEWDCKGFYCEVYECGETENLSYCNLVKTCWISMEGQDCEPVEP